LAGVTSLATRGVKSLIINAVQGIENINIKCNIDDVIEPRYVPASFDILPDVDFSYSMDAGPTSGHNVFSDWGQAILDIQSQIAFKQDEQLKTMFRSLTSDNMNAVSALPGHWRIDDHIMTHKAIEPDLNINKSEHYLLTTTNGKSGSILLDLISWIGERGGNLGMIQEDLVRTQTCKSILGCVLRKNLESRLKIFDKKGLVAQNYYRVDDLSNINYDLFDSFSTIARTLKFPKTALSAAKYASSMLMTVDNKVSQTLSNMKSFQEQIKYNKAIMVIHGDTLFNPCLMPNNFAHVAEPTSRMIKYNSKQFESYKYSEIVEWIDKPLYEDLNIKKLQQVASAELDETYKICISYQDDDMGYFYSMVEKLDNFKDAPGVINFSHKYEIKDQPYSGVFGLFVKWWPNVFGVMNILGTLETYCKVKSKLMKTWRVSLIGTDNTVLGWQNYLNLVDKLNSAKQVRDMLKVQTDEPFTSDDDVKLVDGVIAGTITLMDVDNMLLYNQEITIPDFHFAKLNLTSTIKNVRTLEFKVSNESGDSFDLDYFEYMECIKKHSVSFKFDLISSTCYDILGYTRSDWCDETRASIIQLHMFIYYQHLDYEDWLNLASDIVIDWNDTQNNALIPITWTNHYKIQSGSGIRIFILKPDCDIEAIRTHVLQKLVSRRNLKHDESWCETS